MVAANSGTCAGSAGATGRVECAIVSIRLVLWEGAMASFTVDVAPAVLVWARTTAGLRTDEVGKKLGVGAAAIEAWEFGVFDDPSFPRLTYARLRHLAALYHRPITVMLLDDPPQGFVVPNDYRRVAGSDDAAPTSALLFELRRLSELRADMIHLANLSDEIPIALGIRADVNEDPERIGERIRAWLGVSIDEHLLWKSDAIRHWANRLEGKGVLVAQLQQVSVAEVRGCSITDEPFPVVAVNAQDAAGGRLFTLMHEVVHIALRLGGLCDLHEGDLQTGLDRDKVERFCNAAAAATLMPAASILGVLGPNHPKPGYWGELDLQFLARMHGTSQEAALLRLVSLNLATREEYERRRQSYLLLRRSQLEAMKDSLNRPIIPVAERRLRAFGRRFVETALGAYQREDIDGVELADLLDMKLDHVPSMARILARR